MGDRGEGYSERAREDAEAVTAGIEKDVIHGLAIGRVGWRADCDTGARLIRVLVRGITEVAIDCDGHRVVSCNPAPYLTVGAS
jgi:hypothetical protein